MKKKLSVFLTIALVFITLISGCNVNYNYELTTSGNVVPNVDVSYDSDKDSNVNITVNGQEISGNENGADATSNKDEDADDAFDSSSNGESDEDIKENNTISDEDKNVINIEDLKKDNSDSDDADVQDNSSNDDDGSDDKDADNPEVNSSSDDNPEGDSQSDNNDNSLSVSEDGEYTSKEEVALYIHTYNHLPSNYITKNEAKELGWDSSKGNLNKVAPGKSIGGDKFGNREGLLPKADGRQYYECDIDYVKGTRNAKRIVYSNDGLVYYTEDHYENFELLYK